MPSDRTNARVVGVLFILAAVTAIIGLLLYDPILNAPDYLVRGRDRANQVILGALFELILACSVVGTSIMLFPYLKRQNESLALGYVCFRLLEAVLIVLGIVSVLSLLTLSQELGKPAAPTVPSFQPSGIIFVALHGWTLVLGPNFMLGVNTTMCSYLLYKSDLVPRFIAVMGLTGAALVLVAAVLEMFGVVGQFSTWGVVLALPVFAYEMTLAVRLIAKGFNPSALAARPA
jgi:hypothetical protein